MSYRGLGTREPSTRRVYRDRATLLGVVTISVVHAGNALFLRVIEDPTDDKPRHTAARHETRRSAPQAVPTDVDSIAFLSVFLRFHHDVGTSIRNRISGTC